MSESMIIEIIKIVISGLFVGLASSVTVGPVAVLCIQRTLSRGYFSGLFSGLGVATADTLMAMAKSDVAKAECRKVYEAIRYSDPMSNDALAAVESQITVKFAALSDAVKANEADKVAELANEVCILVGDRNKKCKLLK